MNILKLTALELASAIKSKKITCYDAVKQVIEHIKDNDKNYNAYITVNSAEALKKAKEIDQKLANGEDLGVLAGVPVAIKDNICTKGIKTTCASKMLENYTPIFDATVVEKLEKSGAIILGKTNLDEFAMGSTGENSYFGGSNNPFNTSHVSGGSSSGSAVAVASNETMISLGSDTGGSIRQPAAFCGVTGFKPSYGTVSRYGLVAYASSLDQIGPIAKDVSDCAAIMDIISGKDEKDGTTLDTSKGYLNSLNGNIKGLKVALPKNYLELPGLDPEIKANILSVAETLKNLGATVTEIDLPFVDYAVAAYYIIASAEASSNLSRFDGVKYGFSANADGLDSLYKKSRTEGFGNEVKKRIMLGTFVLSSGYFDAYYRKALKAKAIIKNTFDKIFESYDIILCPVTPTVAPLKNKAKNDPLETYLSDIFTVSVNIAGLPALSVPCGLHQNGLPIGAQFIGKAFDDQLVLNVGYAYQKATNHHLKFREVK